MGRHPLIKSMTGLLIVGLLFVFSSANAQQDGDTKAFIDADPTPILVDIPTETPMETSESSKKNMPPINPEARTSSKKLCTIIVATLSGAEKKAVPCDEAEDLH